MTSPSLSALRNARMPKPLAAVVLLLVLLLTFMVPASFASAHDVVEASSPADGAIESVMPESVTLTMDNTPAAIGSKIQVMDASGTDWASGAVSVVDQVATQNIKPGAPAGSYTVNWRLVSSDGHPIEGTFSFTSTGGSNGGATMNTQPPITAPTEDVTEPAQVESSFPWTVVVIIAVVVLLIAGLVVFARRKLNQDDEN